MPFKPPKAILQAVGNVSVKFKQEGRGVVFEWSQETALDELQFKLVVGVREQPGKIIANVLPFKQAG